MHSPAGIIMHIAEKTGWTWQYILWGVPWNNILWGLADGPGFDDNDEPVKADPAEGRAKFKNLNN